MAPRGRRIWLETGLLVAAFLLAFAAVTALALILAVAGAPEPGRVARKLAVPLFAGALLLLHRIPLRGLAGAAGLRPLPDRPVGLYLRGFAAGAGSVAVLCALLLLAGARKMEVDPDTGKLLFKAGWYVVGGLVLAILEEGVFRGLIQGRLQRRAGTGTAILLGSAVFAAAHFLRPPEGRPGSGVAGALDVVPGVLAGLATVPERLNEFAGLLLVGLVLAVVRWRTGGIVAGMGIHAGWYWVRSFDGRVIEEVRPFVAEHALLIGSERFYDGIVGWAALLGSLGLALALTPRSGARRRAAGP